MEIPNNSILLELHVPDFEKVKEYYTKLGFEVVWERQPEEFKGYLVLKRENSILCFWAGNDYVYKQEYFKQFPQDTPRGYGMEIVVMVEDVERFYEEVKSFANVVEDLRTQPWGLKDFRTTDPFGYYLRFTEYHDILSESNAVK